MTRPVRQQHVRVQVVPQLLEGSSRQIIKCNSFDVIRQEPAASVERPVIVRTEAKEVAHLVWTVIAKRLDVRCLRHRTTRRHELDGAPLTCVVVEGLHRVGDTDPTRALISRP